jgi:hypothetical protein
VAVLHERRAAEGQLHFLCRVLTNPKAKPGAADAKRTSLHWLGEQLFEKDRSLIDDFYAESQERHRRDAKALIGVDAVLRRRPKGSREDLTGIAVTVSAVTSWHDDVMETVDDAEKRRRHGELPLTKGDPVLISSVTNPGADWWFGTNQFTQREGRFPARCVENELLLECEDGELRWVDAADCEAGARIRGLVREFECREARQAQRGPALPAKALRPLPPDSTVVPGFQRLLRDARARWLTLRWDGGEGLTVEAQEPRRPGRSALQDWPECLASLPAHECRCVLFKLDFRAQRTLVAINWSPPPPTEAADRERLEEQRLADLRRAAMEQGVDCAQRVADWTRSTPDERSSLVEALLELAPPERRRRAQAASFEPLLALLHSRAPHPLAGGSGGEEEEGRGGGGGGAAPLRIEAVRYSHAGQGTEGLPSPEGGDGVAAAEEDGPPPPRPPPPPPLCLAPPCIAAAHRTLQAEAAAVAAEIAAAVAREGRERRRTLATSYGEGFLGRRRQHQARVAQAAEEARRAAEEAEREQSESATRCVRWPAVRRWRSHAHSQHASLPAVCASLTCTACWRTGACLTKACEGGGPPATARVRREGGTRSCVAGAAAAGEARPEREGRGLAEPAGAAAVPARGTAAGVLADGAGATVLGAAGEGGVQATRRRVVAAAAGAGRHRAAHGRQQLLRRVGDVAQGGVVPGAHTALRG